MLDHKSFISTVQKPKLSRTLPSYSPATTVYVTHFSVSNVDVILFSHLADGSYFRGADETVKTVTSHVESDQMFAASGLPVRNVWLEKKTVVEHN